MTPRILPAGEGETITERPNRFVQIKGATNELALTESQYGAGERGPDPHVHRRHADCFWVLDGSLVFELAAGTRLTAGAGAFVLVPPGVVHTFRNEGPDDARFLNIHAPSMAFDDHLRALARGDDAAAERFDTFAPPADGGLPATDALLRASGDGELLRFGESQGVIKAGRDDAGGHVAVLETTIAPGFRGPVPHRHRHMTDSFYVLHGTLTLQVDGEHHELGEGGFALAPPGTTHTFSNPGDHPVRLINVMAPGGLEGYLREAAAQGAAGPPDAAVMAQIASRFDFEPVED